MGEISPCYDLTLDASQTATQRLAFISSSGGGKSFGCGRLVEELHDAGVPVIVVDTVGIWKAVRLAADGKGPGLPFVIIGGDHGDVPLALGRGRELATFVVRQNASVVLDVSDLMPDERAGFVADFFEQALVEIKAARRVRFVVLDEGQDLAPEKPGKGEARMLRAVGGFVRKSRNHNCGVAILTQRPQDVSKSVLNQVGNLFVGMLFGEHERKAIAAWVSSKANSVDAHAQLKKLAELQPGDFFFWSPSWRQFFGKVRFRPKRTFDGSSNTPIDPDAELGQLAPVDVAALRELLAPAKLAAAPASEDPVEHWAGERVEAALQENDRLRQQLAELRGEVHRTLAHLQESCVDLSRKLAELGGYAEAGLTVLGRCACVVEHGDSSDCPVHPFGGPRPPAPPVHPLAALKPAPDAYLERRERGQEPDRKPAPAVATEDDELSSYEDGLVAALKANGPLTRRQLGLVAGVSSRSSTFSTALAKLLADGWVVDVDGKLAPGALAVSGPPKLVRGRGVREFWRHELDDYSRKLFDVVASHGPSGVTRKEIAKLAGVSGRSSTFSTAIGRMKRGTFFVVAGGKVALSPEARWAMFA